jgi:hypothetical protein
VRRFPRTHFGRRLIIASPLAAMSFTGTWEESGSIPQDTASYTNRFTLVQQGDRVTGEYVREVSRPDPNGGLLTRSESPEPIDAQIVDGAINVELGWMRVATTLQLEGGTLLVNDQPYTKR